VSIVDNPDYEGQKRATSFDLATVPRYRPLGLKSLELRAAADKAGAASAEIRFRRPTTADFVVDLRVKSGQADAAGEFSLADTRGRPALTVRFGSQGRIECLDPSGGEVCVAAYAPERWYNVSLEVSPARHRYQITVQDDRINVNRRNDLPFLAGADQALTTLRLVQREGPRGAWIWYDAIAGYER